MRVLLDHNFPPQLRADFPDDLEVETATYRGWEGLDDDELLDAAEKAFSVLVTLDTSIPEQRNTEDIALGVVVVDVHPIYPEELKKHITNIAFAVHAAAEKESVVRVTKDSVDFVEE